MTDMNEQDERVTYRVDHMPPQVASLLDSVSFTRHHGIAVEYRGEVVDITVDIDRFVPGSTMRQFLLEHGNIVDDDGRVCGQDDVSCDGGCGCRCNEPDSEEE